MIARTSVALMLILARLGKRGVALSFGTHKVVFVFNVAKASIAMQVIIFLVLERVSWPEALGVLSNLRIFLGDLWQSCALRQVPERNETVNWGLLGN